MTYVAAPSEIQAATAGAVKPSDLRIWMHRKLFNTALKASGPGRARDFPREAVIEAALLSHFSSFGVNLKQAKQWNKHILDRLHADGHVSKFGNPKASSSSVNLVFFRPKATEGLTFVAAPASISAKTAVEMVAGFVAPTATYPFASTLIGAVNIAGLIDHLDFTLDHKRFPHSGD